MKGIKEYQFKKVLISSFGLHIHTLSPTYNLNDHHAETVHIHLLRELAMDGVLRCSVSPVS